MLSVVLIIKYKESTDDLIADYTNLYRVSQKKGYRNVIVTHPIYVLDMGKFQLCGSKITAGNF